MAMKIFSLQVKIGTLMILAILLILATGYLSYRSLSAIVSSIQYRSRPDLRLLAIREITSDLETAENSVRIYTYTRKRQDIEPYYAILTGLDDKILSLRAASRNDSVLTVQIDTISSLIEAEILNWNRILELYHSDSLDNYIRRLSARVAVDMLSDRNNEKSILRRVFGRKADPNLAREEIISDLNKIEQQDSIQKLNLMAAESRLANTGAEIRKRFNSIMTGMEEEVIRSISDNAQAADQLALKTYRWLAMFALLGTLLVILVLVVVVRFVRKTRDYQQALIRSKKEAEKLTRTRELFMASMSHELRTPVNVIHGFSEQLLYGSNDEKSRDMLQAIKSTADHLVRIVNDILDFSKLEHAGIELERTNFQIRPIGEEILWLFENKALENNTRLTYSINPSTPLVLCGDPYRLKQILINLVSNAVKFTTNGEIHCSFDGAPRSGESFDLILKVADTGIGIPEDMQDRVFDDFTQAGTEITRKFGGTGLGLSIVKKLVELHQGSISLKSHPNQGTVFTCVLPFAIGRWEDLPASEPGLTVPDVLKDLKILIVEDEAYNRMLFSTLFDRWGLRYEEAKDGLEAVELLRTTRYDIVLMDIRMPGQDGLRTTDSIRQQLQKSKAELPVIGTSANHTAGDLEAFERSGMNAFLPKPFTEKMLLQVLLSVVKPETKATLLPPMANPDHPATPHGRINLDELYHLAGNDVNFVQQLVEKFMESTLQGLHAIQKALHTEEYEKASENAHKIAAPCKHIGAELLYANLKSIETLGRNPGNKSELEKLTEDSYKEFAAIQLILQDHLAKISAS